MANPLPPGPGPRRTYWSGCALTAGIGLATTCAAIFLVLSLRASAEREARAASPIAERYLSAMCAGRSDAARQLTDEAYHRFILPQNDRLRAQRAAARFGRLQELRLVRVTPIRAVGGQFAMLRYRLRGERGAGEIRVGIFRRNGRWAVAGSSGW